MKDVAAVSETDAGFDALGDGDGHPADSALVQACLAGDEAAWEALVERYGRLVYSVARRCGLGDADADDVFQVVFTMLVRHLGALRDQTRLASWLITTAYRESWRVGRANRSHVEIDDPAAAVVDTGAPPAELVAQAERDQLVREGLARLDPRCRELLTALFLEADTPSYEAIGRRLGMPIGSIGPTRARCFKKLEPILVGLGVDGVV
jgi:RNA polymerase sigma factor (sigma-70 family)